MYIVKMKSIEEKKIIKVLFECWWVVNRYNIIKVLLIDRLCCVVFG